jgi:hypothetical protein
LNVQVPRLNLHQHQDVLVVFILRGLHHQESGSCCNLSSSASSIEDRTESQDVVGKTSGIYKDDAHAYCQMSLENQRDAVENNKHQGNLKYSQVSSSNQLENQKLTM